MPNKAEVFRQRPEFLRGRTGEKLVAEILQARGWWILPSYDYAGSEGDKAPKLHGAIGSHVVPDLDASRGGVRRWVEVKTKRAATWTRISGRLEHGLSERHWMAYREVEAITGCPVYLAIYEEESGDVLIATIQALAKHVRVSRMVKASRDEGAMVYLPRFAFQVLFAVHKKSMSAMV